MEHPRMFDEDDPLLARVREICLALPEAEEGISFGRPWFRTRTAFAVYGGGTKGPEKLFHSQAVLLLPDVDTRLALLEDPRCFVPGYLGPKGWMGIDLTAGGGADWSEVAELVDESYRNTAPRRLVAELDARG
ncbi:MmcQ/YjbR family DNA-binding protein [Naasia aerilata]|uniref:Phosphoribosylglycinamide formyltransferase n=1 Tax=Naasia aerilata TaxID=1162966 RepID=A0ABN6XKK7_9MICO|nr:MmcQ/YjbR family DNA-binding protein [Naasia aerilata]BDZ44688.1 phosphoribosylglycinamide formyltransferase [Naasia aerilata]